MDTMPTGRSEQAAPTYRSDAAVLASQESRQAESQESRQAESQESRQAETSAANTQGLFRLA
ncbi:MAG: hypothetical protein CK530_08725, partial [Planctomycetaceae bacterium]